ncbi:MAG: fatty acid desaturase [Myxococcales bacterium]|nr:fatty acid desaturase [Myxococcales bacterium]MCB9671681.1 fatty acid desaturase [Alphaproteobacteria bacterium]MCB9692040.1 fatty acid desaturase [Alphaproteobacteria bacterium]
MADDLVEVRRRLVREHRETLRELQRLRPSANLKIAGLAGLWAVGAGLYLADLGPLALPVVWTLCTSGLLGMAILMHDAAHGLLARDHRWNRALGFVCGAPVLIATTAYRVNHIEHHAFTGTDRDTGDPVAHANRTGISVGRLTSIFLILGTFLVIPAIAHGSWRKADVAQQRAIAAEYALILAGLTVAWAVLPGVFLLHVWVVPFLVGSLANNLRSVAEHAFLERTDPVRNARTVLSNPVVRLIQSNVNYHWEHHLFPGVPWYNLPRLHALLAHERETLGVPVERGYLGWFVRDVLPRLA